MFRRKRWMKCSFCGKPDSEVSKLVAGPRRIFGCVYICDSCVTIAARLMADEPPRSQPDTKGSPTLVARPPSTVGHENLERAVLA